MQGKETKKRKKAEKKKSKKSHKFAFLATGNVGKNKNTLEKMKNNLHLYFNVIRKLR